MTKLTNSKWFWFCIIATLGLVFCVQLGMQIHGTPEDALARQLDKKIQQVTVQEEQVRASLPPNDESRQEVVTLHPNADGN